MKSHCICSIGVSSRPTILERISTSVFTLLLEILTCTLSPKKFKTAASRYKKQQQQQKTQARIKLLSSAILSSTTLCENHREFAGVIKIDQSPQPTHSLFTKFPQGPLEPEFQLAMGETVLNPWECSEDYNAFTSYFCPIKTAFHALGSQLLIYLFILCNI